MSKFKSSAILKSKINKINFKIRRKLKFTFKTQDLKIPGTAKYQIQVTGTKFSWYAYGTGMNSKYAVPLFHTKGTLLNTGTLKLRVSHTWVLYMY